MKRKVSVILILIIAFGCLFGCSGKSDTVEITTVLPEDTDCVVIGPNDITPYAVRTSSPTSAPTASPEPTAEVTVQPETTAEAASPAPTASPTSAPTATPAPTPKPTATATPKPTPKPTPTPEPIEALNYIPGYVNANGVNMRKSPSTSAEVLDVLSLGKNLYITGRNSEWYRVEANGKTGFIVKRLITLGTYATPTPTPKPTAKPTATPTPKPTATPTPKPTASPTASPTANPGGYYTVSPGEFSESDIILVAKLLKKEANSGSTAGLRAIASVVLNRVKNESSHFPNTVPGVIYQHNQFYPEGALDNVTPGSNHIAAARYVFSEHGATLPKKVLFYKASSLGTTWYSYLQYYCTIDDNNFFIAISNGY